MASKLGSLLVKAGKITQEQLEKALSIQKEKGGKIGQILVEMGVVKDENVITEFLGRQLNIGTLNLTEIELNPQVVKLIPVDIARKFNVIAVSKLSKTLIVAISDPENIFVMDMIKFITGFNVQLVISNENDIKGALDQYYDESESLSRLMKDLDVGNLEIVEEESLDEQELKSAIEDKPLVRLVDGLITDAIRRKASDIHIETYEKKLRVRYRIDGILQEMAPLPYKLRAAVVSRIKIMANLDISERRRPQDGRIKVKVAGRKIDLRVSTIPTIFGEKVVMRILDPKSLMLDLTKLGFPEGSLKQFDYAIHQPYGMILVTGPTGSGKTTTLYSALSQLNKPDVNIMTAEDPVEYNIGGINQIQMHQEIGLTFAASLRSFLRQDPDIIMVGEIRDLETAQIAIRAALTGHLVFSTLHTNDAPSTINRLVDMGIPSFLVASSVRMIIAQRLFRQICVHCKEKVEIPAEILGRLDLPPQELKGMEFYRGKGCPTCNNTGFSGRTAAYEVMPITGRLEKLILEGKSSQELEVAANEEGMLSLREAGLQKLKQGITTVEEVLGETAGNL